MCIIYIYIYTYKYIYIYIYTCHIYIYKAGLHGPRLEVLELASVSVNDKYVILLMTILVNTQITVYI